MKNKIAHFAVLTALLGSVISCSPPPKATSPLTTAIDSLKARYAPDSRLAVFDVSCVQQGSVAILRGEVDNPKAKEDVLNLVHNTLGGQTIDSLKILPDPKLGEKIYGIVIPSVAPVRGRPSHFGNLTTEAEMGMVVKLLKKSEIWYYVQLPDNYLGWIHEQSLVTTTNKGIESWKSARKGIVTTMFTWVREQPNSSSPPVCDVVASDLMRLNGGAGKWMAVETPDGRKGFLEQDHVTEYGQWKQTRALTAENIEKTAKMFKGVPYIWGGTSPKGLDCSGFTKMVFRLNGQELTRDANQQASQGEPVDAGKDFENLKKGDLVFFGGKASKEKGENVDHVGIALGGKQFIHTPGGRWVKVDSFDPGAPNYNERLRRAFLRARRIIGTKQIAEVFGK
jgi:cell wall-associated NlpC family hydrolase